MTLVGEPSPLDRSVPKLAPALSWCDGLLVATDFDGTLSPIAASPDEPRITPANRRVLRTLSARPDVVVAVVSGRQLRDLVPRVGLSGLVYAGNHGLELSTGDSVWVHPVARRYRPAIQAVRRLLERTTSSIHGCDVEDKRYTLTVHHRHVPPGRLPAVFDALDTAVETVADERVAGQATAGFDLVDGKESVEIRPPVDWDKGTAVTHLRGWVPTSWRPIYIGDDTTDEDVFLALGREGVTVHVGTDETAARYRIASQEGVAPFLEWVASLRR